MTDTQHRVFAYIRQLVIILQIWHKFWNIHQLKDQNIQRQKISMRRSCDFTFFKLVVETVECLFFSWVEDVPAAERLLTIWDNITKLVKYWEALLKAKRPSSKSYMNVRCTLRSETIFGNWKLFKNNEKYFLFHLKSSFHSQDI